MRCHFTTELCPEHGNLASPGAGLAHLMVCIYVKLPSADTGAHHGCGELWDHGHVDGHIVAALHAHALQVVCDLADLHHSQLDFIGR